MLVLSRKVQEKILIGDNIVIQVVEVIPNENRVKIGIECPKDLPIDREEVRIRKQKNHE